MDSTRSDSTDRMVVALSPAAGVEPGAAAVPNAEAEPEPRVDGITVLLIDDEPDLRSTAELLLRAAGAQVWSAGSALDGLALLRRFHPQVVISDIGLPEHDGYQLLRWVRELPDPALRDTPAVAFTACAAAEDRQRALAAGYQLHLVKPVKPAALVSAVATLARQHPTARR